MLVKSNSYDIIVVGAGFSGLSFTRSIGKEYKVLLLDRKDSLQRPYESTGLITKGTRNLLETLFPEITDYIVNKITTLGLVSPDLTRKFYSSTVKPWIYSTSTSDLISRMSKNLTLNIETRLGSTVSSIRRTNRDLR